MSKDKETSTVPLTLREKLLEMQKWCSGVVKFDSVNPHFKNKYASLEAVIEKLMLQANAVGLIISQQVFMNDGFWCVSTVVADKNDKEVLCVMPIINPKQDAQGFGSALSYAKRYSLMAVFCMVGGQEDDDAETAQGRPTGTKIPTKEVTYQGTDTDKLKLGPMMEKAGFKDRIVMATIAKKCFGKKWDDCEFIIADEAFKMGVE